MSKHYKGSVCSSALQDFLALPDDDQRMVLICTDRASRGVDTSHVQHVVLFDFPRDPSEYVRRVGRTARGAGGQGVVSVLVLGRQACNSYNVHTMTHTPTRALLVHDELV